MLMAPTARPEGVRPSRCEMMETLWGIVTAEPGRGRC